jgi:hypothetical protein
MPEGPRGERRPADVVGAAVRVNNTCRSTHELPNASKFWVIATAQRIGTKGDC